MRPAMWRRTIDRTYLRGLLGLGLALAPAGCGPSGVGSVDFNKAPDARAIGAPPKARAVEVRRPRAGSRPRTRTGPFAPG